MGESFWISHFTKKFIHENNTKQFIREQYSPVNCITFNRTTRYLHRIVDFICRIDSYHAVIFFRPQGTIKIL